jgi:Raf kinase inhibitor-like YbhB/YbcL family protein
MLKRYLFFLTAFLPLFFQFAQAEDFKLTSPDVKQDQEMALPQVFNSFGCTGKNVSPELSWSGIPAGTKSLALTLYDPDAPTGSGWWHWLVFNIPADTKKLAADAGNVKSGKLPKGAIQNITDFGSAGYGGPCPPQGDKPHHYIFTIYALKDTLTLDGKTSAAMVGYYIGQNQIGSASITAIYHRP